MCLKRILIVEDDSDTRLAYHIILKVKHYETSFVKDPLSCLWEAHRFKPNLIIMDIGLTADDGFRAMSQLKAAAHLAEIPVIVVSGGDKKAFKSRALSFGAYAYLQKPIDPKKMMSVIARLIGDSDEEVTAGEPSDLRRLSAVNT
ncbi:MAG: response regulator [Candidatus Acidiferrales bacterium]